MDTDHPAVRETLSLFDRSFCDCHRTVYQIPSVAEQMGGDPMSKLAAAIHRLCDLAERV